MNPVKAYQFNGQELPEGAEWDMGGTWVVLPNKTRKYIMPGDWLIGEAGNFTEVLNNSDFQEMYSVEVIIKPKTNIKMTENASGAPTDAPKKSIGELRVRADFNVSGKSIVDEIKAKSAELINICETLKERDGRLASIAQTSYEEAAMWAVKAATA